jgi:hypothetical protein
VIERVGTWGEVDVGTTLLSPQKLPMIVVQRWPSGGLRLENQHHRSFLVAPKPANAPVTLLESSPEEAELLLMERLGAHRMLAFETDKRTPERNALFIVPAFPAKGTYDALPRARDHVDWYHGCYSGDAQYAGGFRNLAQISAAHDQMHESGFIDHPHTHKEA